MDRAMLRSMREVHHPRRGRDDTFSPDIAPPSSIVGAAAAAAMSASASASITSDVTGRIPNRMCN
jgi:hypothetical protein